MFEKSSRLKLRFNTCRGLANTEDLWDFSLEDLDDAAKSLNKEIKAESEESFITDKTKANTILELKFEIVKHVIKVKLDEKTATANAVVRAEKKKRILELINIKENEQMSSKSLDELRQELEGE